MTRKATKQATQTTNKPAMSNEVRDRIFAYFQSHRAKGLRVSLSDSERTKAYATFRRTKMYDITIYFAKDGKVWMYVYSRDPDGKLDKKILREIDHRPSTGATFEDCSGEKRFLKKSRLVLKLHRPFDWRTLTDREIALLLDDYNWLYDELQRIGVL